MTNLNLSNQINSDPLLCRKRAAAYLGVTPKTLAQWASTGRYNLPYFKIGSRAMYRRSDLDAFIEGRRSSLLQYASAKAA